jgi:glucosamine-phosphate N-acetyltransferase
MESKESKEIIVRKAQWEDHDSISHILSKSFDIKSGSTRRWWNILSDSSVFPYVVEIDGEVRGTATLYVLEKLIHSGGKVGIIEDVAVSEYARGKGLGKILIDELSNQANLHGCYKVILSCSEENVEFYKKCDFYKHEVTMRMDLKSDS